MSLWMWQVQAYRWGGENVCKGLFFIMYGLSAFLVVGTGLGTNPMVEVEMPWRSERSSEKVASCTSKL